jgi:hypothetical protein
MASRGHSRFGYHHQHQRHSRWEPGHPDQFPYINTWYILTICSPEWIHFHAPHRHTAILVNGKLKEKKFEVHHTSECEQSGPPPYALPVRSVTLASLKSKSNAGDPNLKDETHLSLYPPLPPMIPKEEMSHWGMSPNSGRLTNKKGGVPAAVLHLLHQASKPPLSGRWVICGWTHARNTCINHSPPQTS